MAELRWILLGLTLLLLAGIWWWGTRQSRQAPGNAELRESPSGNLAVQAHPHSAPHAAVHSPAHAHPPAPAAARVEHEPAVAAVPEAGPRDWGVPPFEPLSIRTTDSDGVPALDRPMMADADAFHVGGDSAPAPRAGELQRIVTIRVCAAGESRWPGTDLMAALESHGLAYGRYHVYHRNHVDGRSLFSVASLVEPGTFDLGRMGQEEFRGVTLFAVLPGPIEPLQTVDALFATARGLAERLSGTVQDAQGMPFSPQRAAALREDVAHFQALLPA